jgi:hypothetical protein
MTRRNRLRSNMLARDFTEVLIIYKSDFDQVSENYMQAIRVIQEALQNWNYLPLKIICYICKQKGRTTKL